VLGRVTLPMLRPALVNAGLLVCTLSIESLGIPLVFGSPQGHDLVASYLYDQWSSAFTPGPPVVSAGATVLLGCACALLLLRGRLLRDQARFVAISGRRGATGSVRLPTAARLALGVLLGLYVAVTTFAPIAALALSSVTTQLTPLIAPWHLFTAGNWRAIGHGEFGSSIRNTVEIALVGALITTAVVALATAVAHRSAFPLRRGLPFLLLFPRAIPGLIIGIGFFWTFLLVNPPGHALLNGLWGMTLVDRDHPDYPADPAAGAVRGVHLDVHLHPQRLRPRPVPRHPRPPAHGCDHAAVRAAGGGRAGRGACHGAGRDHGRRDRRRRAAVLDQIERTPECLKSPCRA
jgi:iron(III) transport system permease protein